MFGTTLNGEYRAAARMGSTRPSWPARASFLGEGRKREILAEIDAVVRTWPAPR